MDFESFNFVVWSRVLVFVATSFGLIKYFSLFL